MVDITRKSFSLRSAVAKATVLVSKSETIDAIRNKTVPKGNVFETARTAGLFAVKRTSDMIPDCHPIPVEFTKIDFEIDGLQIIIRIEARAIYRTGVEVEAMHGASVVALTIYDMLKPIDKGIEIQNIKLLRKRGGKSNMIDRYRKDLNASVIVCSDSISAGKKEDKAGKAISEILQSYQIHVKDYLIIPDEPKEIENILNQHVKQGVNLLIFTGGTGLSPRDYTPETLRPLLDREIEGIAEAMRNYGQERMPYSMMSRSLAGIKDKTLILALPGSTKGAEESMNAIFPHVMHIFDVLDIEFKH
jgi:cyclic pyranopterin monophosphate synthase